MILKSEDSLKLAPIFPDRNPLQQIYDVVELGFFS
jgi:hypothetical protein